MAETRERTTRPTGAAMVLRALGAAALGYSGYLHLRIGLERPPLFADGQVTLSGLFLAQAVVAAVVAVWVLVRGDRLAWTAVAAVALGSLAALVLSAYVRIPAVGPFPGLFEPVWYADKYLAAAAAAVAAAVALGVLLGRRPGRR